MRILVIQRSLVPPGGGNAVAAWMVQALTGQHAVDTLTLGDWSPAQSNAFYGTSIPDASTVRHLAPWPWRWLVLVSNDRVHRLRRAVLLRRARQLAAHYDLMITSDDFGVFETPGIQYVNYPEGTPGPTRFPALVGVYFRFCDWWMGRPWSLSARNLTLANSEWTAARLRGGGSIRVLYPPVVEMEPGEPWGARANTVLCIGRFHESKRIEVAISIVRRVRAGAIPDARLVIVGSAVDPAYTRRVKQAAAREGGWIEVREDLSRADLNRLMGCSRYGVHAMAGEHFGMATAEMTRAGCLVFPHRSGGSVEIVDGAAELLWDTEEEAVARITAIADAPVLRDRLLARLRTHAEQFGADRFVDRFRAIVSEWDGG